MGDEVPDHGLTFGPFVAGEGHLTRLAGIAGGEQEGAEDGE
jgi:hypothetical protein